MTQYHACVWIDHREARIFSIEAKSAEETTMRDANATHHIHRKADQVGLGKAPVDDAFFAEVAGKLAPFQAILLVGPGLAHKELASYLAKHAPDLSKRVWGSEPMDHPTEPEIVAAARKYFHAADRMHPTD